MILSNVYSVSNAQTIADALHHFRTERKYDYFKLEMVKYHQGQEIPFGFLWINFDTNAQQQVFTFPNGIEMAQCITKEGKHVSIILGKPTERSIQPALIVLEETHTGV